jgi:hypothetical protein
VYYVIVICGILSIIDRNVQAIPMYASEDTISITHGLIHSYIPIKTRAHFIQSIINHTNDSSRNVFLHLLVIAEMKKETSMSEYI